MRLFLLFVLFSGLFLFYSCKKYAPAVPAFFVRTQSVNVSSIPGKEGTSSHKITDLFLYVNGQFQGAYPIGNLMPVPSDNKSAKIQIFAGIKNNGIADTRIYWPFYDLLELDTLVESGKTISRSFIFRYSPAIKFVWLENFEGLNNSLVKSQATDTIGTFASAENSFEGRSYELGLSSSKGDFIAQVESNGKGFELPRGSLNVYLELNYKGNAVFEVGLIGEDNLLKPALNINPQVNWNKIYIQLASAVSEGIYSSKYKVYFKLLKQGEVHNPKVFLDNIKLMYL